MAERNFHELKYLHSTQGRFKWQISSRADSGELFAAEIRGGVSSETGEATVELGKRLVTDVESNFRNPRFGLEQFLFRPFDAPAVHVIG